MTRPALSSEIRSGSVSVMLPLCHPGTDIPAGEAEYIVFPTVEGGGRWDDVWVVNFITGKPMTLNDEMGRAVLKRIEAEQPEVWNDIRVRACELAREEVG